MAIQQQPVTSSMMTAAGHDGDQTAEVTLSNGKQYRISGMGPEAFQAMLDSDSIGRHFNQVVKPSFTVVPVPEIDGQEEA